MEVPLEPVISAFDFSEVDTIQRKGAAMLTAPTQRPKKSAPRCNFLLSGDFSLSAVTGLTIFFLLERDTEAETSCRISSWINESI